MVQQQERPETITDSSFEVREEDLTVENIREFFRQTALKVLGDADRAPELVVHYHDFRGTTLNWMGQDVTWDTFLTKSAIALKLAASRKGITSAVKEVTLNRLFQIAGIERKQRKKEFFTGVRHEELTEKNLAAVLKDAAGKFLGNEKSVSRLSPGDWRKMRSREQQRVSFCGRTLHWTDFIWGCAGSFGLARLKSEAMSCEDEVLDRIFRIAKIKRARGRF